MSDYSKRLKRAGVNGVNVVDLLPPNFTSDELAALLERVQRDGQPGNSWFSNLYFLKSGRGVRHEQV